MTEILHEKVIGKVSVLPSVRRQDEQLEQIIGSFCSLQHIHRMQLPLRKCEL